ncbi:MAG: hypothetical protein HYX94_01750 [Chloroflexi bacterium]|nr:hypothetical protein [Chloroflexota bacterium]
MTRREIERDRHRRLVFYTALSFSLAMLAYFFLDLDRLKALAYGACAFVLLGLLNYRAILARMDVGSPERQGPE